MLEWQFRTCPVCGKDFIPAPQHSYTVLKNGARVLACSYGCVRKWEQRREVINKKV